MYKRLSFVVLFVAVFLLGNSVQAGTLDGYTPITKAETLIGVRWVGEWKSDFGSGYYEIEITAVDAMRGIIAKGARETTETGKVPVSLAYGRIENGKIVFTNLRRGQRIELAQYGDLIMRGIWQTDSGTKSGTYELKRSQEQAER